MAHIGARKPLPQYEQGADESDNYELKCAGLNGFLVIVLCGDVIKPEHDAHFVFGG